MDKRDLFAKKFSILQEISSALVVSEDIGSLANLMLDLGVSYTSAEKGSLMLVTDCDELFILAAKGIDPQFVKIYRSKIGEGIAGIVAKERRPVLVEDIDADSRFHSTTRDRYRTKSFISCPLVSKERLLGVLNINDKKDGTSFTADEFELLTVIANHAAIALENAFLLNQLKTKADELEAINRRLIETDIGKTEFLTRVSHGLRTPLNSVKGAIYHLQQQADRLPKEDRREFQSIIAAETDKLISIVENLLHFLRLEDETRLLQKNVIRLGELFERVANAPVLKVMLATKRIHLTLPAENGLPDVIGDAGTVLQLFTNLILGIIPSLEPEDKIDLNVHGADVVSVHLDLSRALPEAVLSALNATRDVALTDHDEDLLKIAFARSAAGLHRWKLLAINSDHGCSVSLTIPTSARERVDVFVNKSMDSFVEFIAELLDLDICSIMLSDEATSELTVKSARGLDDEVVKRTRVKFGDRIAGWVALEGKPLFVEDIESDPRFSKKSIPQYNSKSFMSLPLKIDGQVVGVLNLNNKKTSEPFTLRDFYIASVLSERIAYFLRLIKAGPCTKDEFSKFLTSLNRLLDRGKPGQELQHAAPSLVDGTPANP
ncbi:MAG TPA: GAF domain-containing protein [Nitrospirota bacterium]|nr:GAF domain-containing protein [Nitrospirota bacterium]